MFQKWFGDGTNAADFYIDLGTANILIAGRGKGIIINEPTIIALSEISPGKKKVVAVGKEALDRISQAAGNIYAVRPLKDGVIADFETTQTMLKYFFEKTGMKTMMGRPKFVISLPYGVTEVEKKAVIDAGKYAGAKEVILIDEPMASAIGSELPIKSPQGCMVIDIGGGTTEVAVIALADIVYCQAIRMGGTKLDEAIINFLKNRKGIIISDILAEHLKVNIGTACPKKDIRTMQISGRDAGNGLNKTIEVSSEDIGNAMDDGIRDIINAIHTALENTPPELVSDIIEKGLTLAGGGALIRDIDLRIQNEIRLNVNIAKEPLLAIARGGEMVLSDPDLLDKITIN